MHWDKILSFLRIRPRVGGLEISDAFLRYAFLDGDTWRRAALRLPPGIVKGGKIMDYAKFVDAVRMLHTQIVGRNSRRRINVVVSLSSVNVYSQVFSLPMIEGENLEKAIQLNIQMVSPGESSQTYSGWQLLGEDQKSVRLEVLSSFINRVVVDEISKALKEGGFMVHSIESRALSLTRLIRKLAAGFDSQKSYILLNLDSSGIEFLVILHAQLYFQYFNSWQDLYGDERKVPEQAFTSAIIRNMHQVLNFYNSHWSEPLAGVFLLTTGFEEKISKIINDNFQITIFQPQIEVGGVNADWFVALGSGLRGIVPQKNDQEISLLGVSAQDEFRFTQALTFMRFWRLLIPVSLVLLLFVFVGSDVVLRQSSAALQAQALNGGTTDPKATSDLQIKVQTFNRSVALLESALSSMQPKMPVFAAVKKIADDNGVTIVRFNYQSLPIVVSARGASEDALKSFAQGLKSNDQFVEVNWSLSDIHPDASGVSFSISFSLAPPKTP